MLRGLFAGYFFQTIVLFAVIGMPIGIAIAFPILLVARGNILVALYATITISVGTLYLSSAQYHWLGGNWV